MEQILLVMGDETKKYGFYTWVRNEDGTNADETIFLTVSI